MVGVMKIMETCFKRSHACTATLNAPSTAAGHCRPTPLLETPGHSGSVSCGGHCSFLLGPGAGEVLSVPSKSLFLQYCVCSGGSMVGLMVTSSKRAYSISWSTAPRASLVGMGFDSKCNFAHPTILLGLLCSWTWAISSKSLQLHNCHLNIAQGHNIN